MSTSGCLPCEERQAALLAWAKNNKLLLAGALAAIVGLLWAPALLTRRSTS